MPAKKKSTRRPARLTPMAQKVREAAIIADLKAGVLSYRKIAAKHKVSLPTVNAKARKAGIRRPRGRRPAGVVAVPFAAAGPSKRGKRVRKAAAGTAVRRARRASRTVRTDSRPGFNEAFRQMVLHYYPSITLAKFDRLAKLVAQTVG